ncbi:tRNA (adenosine(37)-N6)-threonylcarbamoyltransferase complex dimerization subunit type 1 TsaB [Salidesulfovibrio onnuriiensis]|uniref:tRNA (adenosine(37)-N6)-threonylcarbamoyltransferase complex dimerization subunit type 1 TsaB n=1 Tax=Salidesulfovibrio onnuriiensis TaxID=2583823 RepID=UPI0011CA71B3|nr:tRNA (adenosine(37)-N6)-threonylcarbamoyltransferase complex dimerization subunit type 1 TsaB [Salidesulfovibrio onnuriiensis]
MTSADNAQTAPGLLLVLNGCEERLQFALGRTRPDGGHDLLASRQWTVPGQSVKYLVPGVAGTLESLALGPEHIHRIACTRGPGSFTGMRLVLAAAMGLAAGGNLQVAGLDYLPLLASGPMQLLEGTLHVLTYARRGQVYVQSFDSSGGAPLCPPRAVKIDEAVEHVRAHDPHAALMGTGLRKNPEAIAALLADMPSLRALDALWDNPTPETLLTQAEAASFATGDIEPMYLRASDAEDNLPQIAAKRGIDPEEAKKKLPKYL